MPSRSTAWLDLNLPPRHRHTSFLKGGRGLAIWTFALIGLLGLGVFLVLPQLSSLSLPVSQTASRDQSSSGDVPDSSPNVLSTAESLSAPSQGEAAKEADPGDLRQLIARLSPSERADDTSASQSSWPIVAIDPDSLTEPPIVPQVTPTTAPEIYVVAPGDTFFEIAEKWNVSAEKLASFNNISNRESLAAGQKLLIPDTTRQPQRVALSNRGATLRPRFAWPARGYISTDYGEIGLDWIGGKHMGLDIASPQGNPVLAAERGVVLESGWATTRGYGNYIVIDHGMGYRTLYGHMSALHVKVGAEVSRGQRIGDIGSTGYSSGPHLHFEIQLNGQTLNPGGNLPE